MAITRRNFVVSLLVSGSAFGLSGVASADGFRDAFLSVEYDPTLRGRVAVSPWDGRIDPVAGFTDDRVGRAFAITAGLFLAGSLAVTIRIGGTDILDSTNEEDWKDIEGRVLLNLGRLGLVLRKSAPAVRIAEAALATEEQDTHLCPAFLSLAEIDPDVLAATIPVLEAPRQDRPTYEALQATLLAWIWVTAIMRRPAPDLTPEARAALAGVGAAVTSSLLTPGGVQASVLRDAAQANRSLLPIVVEAISDQELVDAGSVRITFLEGFTIQMPPFMSDPTRRSLKAVVDQVQDEYGLPYVLHFDDASGAEMPVSRLMASIASLPRQKVIQSPLTMEGPSP